MEKRKKTIKLLESLAKYYSTIVGELGFVTQFGAKPVEIFATESNSIPTQVNQVIQQPEPITTQASKPTQQQKEAIPKKISDAKLITPHPIAVDLSNITTLAQLMMAVDKTCVCELKEFATKTVFGDGNPNAKILVIGEAPGQEEDLAGIPFIGRSGELLMNAFKSIKLERERNFFITNNIFWRPPGNRKPTQEEMNACKPYLIKMIEIIKPEVIICVGSVATQNVLETQETISNLRGKTFHEAKSLRFVGKIFGIYHPSYLLRNPSKKYEMYKDLLFIKEQMPHIL